MDEHQLQALKPESDRPLDHYAPLFGHEGNQAHSRRFVRGLLRGGDRRNTENIAEALNGGSVRSLPAFVTTGAWKDAGVPASLRGQILEALGDGDAVWSSDETGFPKKGPQSVGVTRQYSGTLGRTDNCQVAVFANYGSTKGHAFVGRRLFRPEDGANDAARRAEAGVPGAVTFRTEPALALAMIAEAVAAGVPFRWAGGGGVCGDDPTLVQGVRALGKWCVLDISCGPQVRTEAPQVTPAGPRPRPARGRPPAKPLVVGGRRRADEIAAVLPAGGWRRVVVGEGRQGPRTCAYAETPVRFREDELPGPAGRSLVYRSLGQQPGLEYHRSSAPVEAPLEKLARVRGVRWTIEEDIQSCEGECGLDEYETRGRVGWHHHTSLSALARAFRVLRKHRRGGTKVLRRSRGRNPPRGWSPPRRTYRRAHRPLGNRSPRRRFPRCARY